MTREWSAPLPPHDDRTPLPPHNDHAALLAAAARDDMALCTLVGLDGSFSRRIGAQIAVAPDGTTVGSLSDGCLERQLAADVLDARADGLGPRLKRYGKGSPVIDFRLPCGSGLDMLIDPAPDAAALADAAAGLRAREETAVALPLPPDASPALLRHRRYIPALRVLLFGEGPELTAFATLAQAAGTVVETHARATATTGGMALGRVPPDLDADSWTAILLLFHDHEWERAILEWAITTPAFFIGAQGGKGARGARLAELTARGATPEAIARIRSPVGLIARARDPEVLALSVLAEIVAEHDLRQPHS